MHIYSCIVEKHMNPKITQSAIKNFHRDWISPPWVHDQCPMQPRARPENHIPDASSTGFICGNALTNLHFAKYMHTNCSLFFGCLAGPVVHWAMQTGKSSALVELMSPFTTHDMTQALQNKSHSSQVVNTKAQLSPVWLLQIHLNKTNHSCFVPHHAA